MLVLQEKCIVFISCGKCGYHSAALHCKKSSRFSRRQTGCHLPNFKLPLAGNNLTIPGQGEFGKWHPAKDRKISNLLLCRLFFGVHLDKIISLFIGQGSRPLHVSHMQILHWNILSLTNATLLGVTVKYQLQANQVISLDKYTLHWIGHVFKNKRINLSYQRAFRIERQEFLHFNCIHSRNLFAKKQHITLKKLTVDNYNHWTFISNI
jgi:hypothetical protein